MDSLWSDEDSDHRRPDQFESYADVSESESCDSHSSDDHSLAATTTTTTSNLPLSGPQFCSNLPFPVPSPLIPAEKTEKVATKELSEVELMKKWFAKLLLGEDMSGGRKGVCTALAISNAITNLSATVFGDLWKLEPLAPEKKSMWKQEMNWLISVSDSIIELTPSWQQFPDGETFEVMVTQPRSDLYMNLPVLKKLDAMLICMLDGFCESDFYYVDRGVVIAGGEHIEGHSQSMQSSKPSIRLEEKWWLPFPKVPPDGIGGHTMDRLQQSRECTNQIFKAAVAINSSVLSEMDIPNAYLEGLPKSAKGCLGETLYRFLIAAQFSPEYLLDYLEISSEYTTLEIANKIEAAVHIWKQKDIKSKSNHVKPGRSAWGGTVKGLVGDRKDGKLLASRAETLLRYLKLRFSGLPRTTLDISKIQYNKDVGQAILESYSRVVESLAFNLMARIDDLLYVDDATKQRRAVETVSKLAQRDSTTSFPLQKPVSPRALCSPATLVTAPTCGPSNLVNGRHCFVRKSSFGDTLRW